MFSPSFFFFFPGFPPKKAQPGEGAAGGEGEAGNKETSVLVV